MKPPIADPFAAPETFEDTRSFRGDFFRCFVGYFVLFFCLTSGLSALWIMPLLPPREIGFALGILLAFVICLALSLAAMGLLFSVEVGAKQLEGRDFWGMKRAVSWSEITRVRGAWFVFRYALISTPQKRNIIWLPLILADMPAFARAVEELAPEDNPLRLWMQKRNF